MEQTKKKRIYNEVIYNKEFKDGQLFERLFSVTINSYKIDDLIINNSKVNDLAMEVSNRFVATFQHSYQKTISDKQQQFSQDCARLIFGELKHPDKAVVIPAKAGFGKSTLIQSIVETLIDNIGVFHEHEKELDLGMIIVSDRIEDLKNIQFKIREQFGYYDEFKKVDWVYVMEGWNKEHCLNGITEYIKGCCTSRNCSFYQDCRVFKQQFDQMNSPIVAMSKERFSYYRSEKISAFTTYNCWGGKRPRNIIMMDEKPVLEKQVNVDEKLLLKLSNAVNEIPIFDSETTNNKMYMKHVLHQVQGRLLDLQNQYKEYRSRIVLHNEDIFEEKFLELFYKYLHPFTEELAAIQLFFQSGGLFCNTSSSIYFKVIFPKEEFRLEQFRTYIFDATGEGDPSYTPEFVHFNIDDYKEYDNVTFHIINENMSRSAIENSKSKLKVVTNWIRKNFHEPTYVVSYKMSGKMNINKQLTKQLEHHLYVVLDQDQSGKAVIPYFGNTKGKNLFQHCRKMVQIGWNRLPSDETVAAFIYTFLNLDRLRQLNESDINKVQNYIQFDGKTSRFGHDNLNIFELRRMLVDLEQEVFRTKVRDFSSDEQVDIYLFGGDYRLKEMIGQRFKGCTFNEEQIPEFELEKNHQKGVDKQEKRLYTYIETWDGQSIAVTEVRKQLDITDTYWSRLIKKENIQHMLKQHDIQISRLKGGGRQQYMHRSSKTDLKF